MIQQPRLSIAGSIVVLICSLFVACKPSDPAPPAGYYGELSTFHISGSLMGMPLDSAWEAYAAFTSTPGVSASAFVDSITVNGLPMEIDGDSVAYLSIYPGGMQNFSAGASWEVVGANGIPSFTYNYGGAYPAYLAALPDTIDRSAGYTFVLNGTTTQSVDSMRVEILGLGVDSVGKSAALSAGGINFSPGDLSGFTPGEGFLILTAATGTTQTFGGKNIHFSKLRQYVHPLYFR